MKPETIDHERRQKFAAGVSLIEAALAREMFDVQVLERSQSRFIASASRIGQHIMVISKSVPNPPDFERVSMFTCSAQGFTAQEFVTALMPSGG